MHEVEHSAQQDAAATAQAAEQQLLHGIPHAAAEWPDVLALMQHVSGEMVGDKLQVYCPKRADAIYKRCSSWAVGKTAAQGKTINDFKIKFRSAVS